MDDQLITRSPFRGSGDEHSGAAYVDEAKVCQIEMRLALRGVCIADVVRHGIDHHCEQLVVSDVDLPVHGHDALGCSSPQLW